MNGGRQRKTPPRRVQQRQKLLDKRSIPPARSPAGKARYPPADTATKALPPPAATPPPLKLRPGDQRNAWLCRHSKHRRSTTASTDCTDKWKTGVVVFMILPYSRQTGLTPRSSAYSAVYQPLRFTTLFAVRPAPPWSRLCGAALSRPRRKVARTTFTSPQSSAAPSSHNPGKTRLLSSPSASGAIS